MRKGTGWRVWEEQEDLREVLASDGEAVTQEKGIQEELPSGEGPVADAEQEKDVIEICVKESQDWEWEV